MIRFKLRNRLHKEDNIRGASIELRNAANAVLASGVTDAHGNLSLNLPATTNGAFTCAILARQTSTDPVGPPLNPGAPVPDRIYRPVTLNVLVTAGLISSATPADPKNAAVAVSGAHVFVDVQPVWMRSAKHNARGETISMIIVHHTACNTEIAVSTFLVEKGPHYMIDTDGQIVKWVPDSLAAWHAGEAKWNGHGKINSRSIGIEIVHKSGAYPEAQYLALLELLGRITTAFPSIDKHNIIGHSDVGTNPDGVLGRKSGDPGSTFHWARLEAKQLGMLKAAGPPALNIYGGYFQIAASGAFRQGDNDKRHRFGGATHAGVAGTPVQELQEDLATIGYSVGRPDGDFGGKTTRAVMMLQEHFFAGGRGTKNPDGRVDFDTAALIKSVAAGAAP